jgi:kinesin family protein C1
LFPFFLSQDSQSEAIKHKEMLANELTCLREELKKITEDRDRIQGQLNAVILEREKYIKFKYETYSKLDKLAIKTEALEVCCFILSPTLIRSFI